MNYDTNENFSDRLIRKKKSKNKKKLILISLCLLLLLAAGGLSIYGYSVYSNYKKLVDDLNKDGTTATNVDNIQSDPFAVMILGEGTNNEDGESGADAISLLVINPKQKVARLIGVPRDSYLPRGKSCDGAGYFDKITNSGESVECLQDTLEAVFDLEINYYVSINFVSFIKIVDALGGVEMNVPDLREGFENYPGNPADGMYLPSSLKTGDQWCEHDSSRNAFAVCFSQFGPQVVNGEQALALARTRHYDSDFGRNERQMELIKAIANKVTDDFNPLTVNKLLTAASGNIKTNISENQFMDFARLGKNLMSDEGTPFSMQSLQLDGEAGTLDGHFATASYNLVSIFSLEDIRMKIAQTLAPDLPTQVNVEAFYFDPTISQYASKYGDYHDYPTYLYDTLDVSNPDVVAQFDYTNSHEATSQN